jgi:hypothetical protein
VQPERLLHQGVHSTVYLGWHRALGRRVVVKSYSLGKLAARHLQNVEREIKALQALRTRCGARPQRRSASSASRGLPRRSARALLSCRVSGVVTLLEVSRSAQEIILVFEPCLRGDLYQLLHREGGNRTLGEEFVCKQVGRPGALPLRFVASTLRQPAERGTDAPPPLVARRSWRRCWKCWRRCTRCKSSTATSSPRTCCSTPAAGCWWATSAWRWTPAASSRSSAWARSTTCRRR